jgi:hypothetical protein
MGNLFSRQRRPAASAPMSAPSAVPVQAERPPPEELARLFDALLVRTRPRPTHTDTHKAVTETARCVCVCVCVCVYAFRGCSGVCSNPRRRAAHVCTGGPEPAVQ